MANEIADMKECFFVTYHGLIKNIAPRLLETMAKKYNKYYRPYIDVERIEVIPTIEIMANVIQSTSRNPFERFMVDPDFNWMKAISDLSEVKRDPLLFFDSEPLVMYNVLNTLLDDNLGTQMVYVYTPVFDVRILKDLEVLDAGRKKIEYISGGFLDVIKTIKNEITAYFLNDVKMIDLLIEAESIQFKNILIANYGYQYKEDPRGKDYPLILDLDDDVDKIEMKYKCRIRTFEVMSGYQFIDLRRDAYAKKIQDEMRNKHE